ncbi:MAG: N-acetylmuramoyl-L-alanine amidase [Candidatus Aminicenantes bacterium]|nr:N-acetylmuramoyl-L-alanine amidase [Candidatus Aminicenantes bacterium]
MTGRTRLPIAILSGMILSFATAAAPSVQTAPAEKQEVSALSEVYNVRSYSNPNYTRIVLDVGAPREYVWNETRTPPEITIDVIQARLNPIVPESVTPAGAGYINRLRLAAKNPSTVRLTIEADWEHVRRYQVFNLFDPFRIVIDIYPKDVPPAPGLTPPPPGEKIPKPAQPAGGGYSLARQLGLGVRTIILDPGHGGADPGCLDPAGPKEKDLTLDIALKLKAILEAESDLAVVLTRETDIYVPLETRTIVASQRKADLFISIHVNAYRLKTRKGSETFFLNFSPDPAVNELAAKENATTTKTIGEMDKIIRKIAQNSRIIESRELAQKIQSNLATYLSRRYSDVINLGAKGGPFWVLLGSEMPAILIEVAHLSNPDEAKRLQSAVFRQNAARGIFEGIKAYIRSLGKG